jgi:hypothetical protein
VPEKLSADANFFDFGERDSDFFDAGFHNAENLASNSTTTPAREIFAIPSTVLKPPVCEPSILNAMLMNLSRHQFYKSCALVSSSSG